MENNKLKFAEQELLLSENQILNARAALADVAYSRHYWKNDEAPDLEADILNQIEDGIARAYVAINETRQGLNATNSDLAVAIGETSNITSASFTGKIIWQNLGRLTTLSFELTTKKELASGATYELISIVEGIPSKKANCVLTTSDGKPYYCYSSPDGKFYVANYTGAAIPANKVLYGQIAFISA